MIVMLKRWNVVMLLYAYCQTFQRCNFSTLQIKKQSIYWRFC